MSSAMGRFMVSLGGVLCDSCRTQTSADVLHKDDEMERVGGRRLETVLLVETAGAIVLGMHEHGASADDVGCLCAPRQRLNQHGLPDASSLLGRVNSESRQKDDGNALSALAPGKPLGRQVGFDASGREAEEGDDAAAPGRDERARLLGLLVSERLMHQVVVEPGDAAVEPLDLVRRVERRETERWLSSRQRDWARTRPRQGRG